MIAHRPRKAVQLLLLLPAWLVCTVTCAQNEISHTVFHPTSALYRNWAIGIGFQTFAMPEAITEEFQYRIPALDLQVLRRIHGGLHVRSRVLIQVLQNHGALGLGWSHQFPGRWSMTVGSNVGLWKGHLVIDKFDTDASGWSYYPDVTIGFNAGSGVLLSFRTEALFKLRYQARVGKVEITQPVSNYNGLAWSLYAEQPFVGKRHIALGFTLQYANFFWATWALFNMKEQPFLYRQITVAIIP